MEYLEHGDLQRYLTERFSECDTVRIASQVVKGLEYMHHYHFIHRDLKPGNLLIVDKPPKKEWSVKISDFGISKRADNGEPAYSTVGIGTLDYMAPEVRLFEPRRKGEKASYTVAADMWSLGSICAHLITGALAFHLTALFRYYQDQGPFTPEEDLASKSESQDCRDFIRALMAKDPKLRPSAKQAAKHRWIKLNQLTSPGAPYEAVAPFAKPSNPPSQLGPKGEYNETAQWDSDASDEEEAAKDATIRLRTPIRQASSPATAIHDTENTPTTTRYFGSNPGTDPYVAQYYRYNFGIEPPPSRNLPAGDADESQPGYEQANLSHQARPSMKEHKQQRRRDQQLRELLEVVEVSDRPPAPAADLAPENVRRARNQRYRVAKERRRRSRKRIWRSEEDEEEEGGYFGVGGGDAGGGDGGDGDGGSDENDGGGDDGGGDGGSDENDGSYWESSGDDIVMVEPTTRRERETLYRQQLDAARE
ncbi:hypothetical protein DL769_002903 [Monosporascus sp. CRB-8-3]|nr:hypothetical protein DL769_002903 [Monosporascus sp. CRB-8-3]